MKKKNIVILGSTGSIGTSSLDIIAKSPLQYNLLAISGNRNYNLFLKQILKFKPKYALLTDCFAYDKIKNKVPSSTKLLNPKSENLIYLSTLKSSDLIISGLVGACGLIPLIESIKKGKTIALANKEPIVMAGKQIMAMLKKYKATILPVDSEPSAILQCLEDKDNYNSSKQAEKISKIFLTASGGPFLKYKGNLSTVTPKQALNHPRWDMGDKITIDSSTLVNKGFEAIELKWLFNVPMSKINIIVHPQSIIHGAVEYADGSIIAKMSNPDMRLPIQYAMTYPNKSKSSVKQLNLFDVQTLQFYKPDFKKFPCLDLILKIDKKGGLYPTVLNAANEIAVSNFIKGKIKFTDIYTILKYCTDNFKNKTKNPTIKQILKTDLETRLLAQDIIKLKKF